MHGEDDDVDIGALGADASRGLDAVEAGQADVHEHDVGAASQRLLDGARAVKDVRDDGHVLLIAKERAQAIAHELMVLGDQDAQDAAHERLDGDAEEDDEEEEAGAALAAMAIKSSAPSVAMTIHMTPQTTEGICVSCASMTASERR